MHIQAFLSTTLAGGTPNFTMGGRGAFAFTICIHRGTLPFLVEYYRCGSHHAPQKENIMPSVNLTPVPKYEQGDIDRFELAVSILKYNKTDMLQEMFYPSSNKNKVNVPIEEDFDIDKVFDYTPKQRKAAEKVILDAIELELNQTSDGWNTYSYKWRMLKSIKSLMEHNIGSTLFKANIRAFFTIATGI